MYIKMEEFLEALYPACPTKVEALRVGRREIENGLFPVGLKVHCLDPQQAKDFDELIERLGGKSKVLEVNMYRQKDASLCFALPPVGSAKGAIRLLECMEAFTGLALFNNRAMQIQICTAGRLSNRNAGLLTLSFSLGSDIIRGYGLNDLETTFSDNRVIPRGRRITIYDGLGSLDKDFSCWARRCPGTQFEKIRILRHLPFHSHRTDVLTGTSRLDIYNVNMLATLLLHSQRRRWYWHELGRSLVDELVALFHAHQLGEVLYAPWIRRRFAQQDEDMLFHDSYREVMAYAISEALRIQHHKGTGGILYQIRDILNRYGEEVRRTAEAQQYGVVQ